MSRDTLREMASPRNKAWILLVSLGLKGSLGASAAPATPLLADRVHELDILLTSRQSDLADFLQKLEKAQAEAPLRGLAASAWSERQARLKSLEALFRREFECLEAVLRDLWAWTDRLPDRTPTGRDERRRVRRNLIRSLGAFYAHLSPELLEPLGLYPSPAYLRVPSLLTRQDPTPSAAAWNQSFLGQTDVALRRLSYVLRARRQGVLEASRGLTHPQKLLHAVGLQAWDRAFFLVQASYAEPPEAGMGVAAPVPWPPSRALDPILEPEETEYSSQFSGLSIPLPSLQGSGWGWLGDLPKGPRFRGGAISREAVRRKELFDLESRVQRLFLRTVPEDLESAFRLYRELRHRWDDQSPGAGARSEP